MSGMTGKFMRRRFVMAVAAFAFCLAILPARGEERSALVPAGDGKQPVRLTVRLSAEGEFAESRRASGPELGLPGAYAASPQAEVPGAAQCDVLGEDSTANAARPAAGGEARSEPEDDPSFRYRVRPGDILNISIPYEADSQKSVPVMPDGYIRYMFDIEVLAAGKTYQEISDQLLEKLRKYYKNPGVTVIGESFQGNSVFVLGPVAHPGAHVIHKDTRLLDVLATSGVLGLLPQMQEQAEGERQSGAVDLDGAYIARDGKVLDVDFRKLMLERRMEFNIRLKPDDFIFVPSTFGSQRKVYICGRVDNPQVYYYTGSLTFMEAMLKAGGTDAERTHSGQGGNTARARTCIIVRKQAEEPLLVDWPAIMKGEKPDVQLCDGDILYVPERKLSYVSRITGDVIGEIVNPLKSILELDDTAKDYHTRDWK